MVREERMDEVQSKAEHNAEERLLDLLLPPSPTTAEEDPVAAREQAKSTRERIREQLRDGRLDERSVEIDVRERSFPSFETVSYTHLRAHETRHEIVCRLLLE